MIHNSNRTIPEVFELVVKERKTEDKAKVLRAYNSRQMKWFVYNMYCVDWSEVEIPEYKPNHRPPEICNASIKTSINRLEAAYEHRINNKKLTKKLLDIVLHEVSKEEAELLVNMMKGKKVKGVSKAVFKEAYPDFFQEDKEGDVQE